LSAERHLGGAREVAGETIAMARDLMAGLRPPALDDFGLIAALRTLAESQSSRLNLQIDVVGDDVTPRPGRLVENSLFRIAQEAVMNAARHASATRIAVAFAERDGRVILTVRDDGVGFDLDAPGTDPDHWGLKSMRERALAIGGILHVESAPGAGTQVTAEVPREAA
jgi:signal transduction histidine kinase